MAPDPGSYDDRTSVETRTLLDFVCHTAATDIPTEVLHESARCLLDHLGLAVAGAEEPAARIAREQCLVLGGDPQARVLGTSQRLRVTDAALVNGISCHALDFDDTHVPTILHPTTPLYAAGTPLAEWRGASGIDLLAAHCAGVRTRRQSEQRALPRALRRGLAHDRHHRRTRVGDRRHQAARPDRNRRHALPQHRGDAGGRPPRAVRHHDQAVPRRPRGCGRCLGGAACVRRFHRRTRPAAGQARHVRGDVVGEHARRSGRRARAALADLRQRGEALRVRRGDPPGHRRGPRPRRPSRTRTRAASRRSGCACTRWCSS